MAMMLQYGVVKQGFARLLGVRWRKALLNCKQITGGAYPSMASATQDSNLANPGVVHRAWLILNMRGSEEYATVLLHATPSRTTFIWPYGCPAGLTTFGEHVSVVAFPLASVATTVHVIVSDTPPESEMVIWSPANVTTHDLVLLTRLPFLVNLKQSKSVISGVNAPSH